MFLTLWNTLGKGPVDSETVNSESQNMLLFKRRKGLALANFVYYRLRKAE